MTFITAQKPPVVTPPAWSGASDASVDRKNRSAGAPPKLMANNPAEPRPTAPVTQRVLDLNESIDAAPLALPTPGETLAPTLPAPLASQLGANERAWQGVPAGSQLSERAVLGEVSRFMRDNHLDSGLPASWNPAQRDRFANLVVGSALATQKNGTSVNSLREDLAAILSLVNRAAVRLPDTARSPLNVGVDTRPLAALPVKKQSAAGADATRLNDRIVHGEEDVGDIARALASTDAATSRQAYVNAVGLIRRLPAADQKAVLANLDRQYLSKVSARETARLEPAQRTTFVQLSTALQKASPAQQLQWRPTAQAVLDAGRDVGALRVAQQMLRSDTNTPPLLPGLNVTLSTGKTRVDRHTVGDLRVQAETRLQASQQLWTARTTAAATPTAGVRPAESPGTEKVGSASGLTPGGSGQAFSAADAATLRNAEHVFVLGFSSTGGGHTARSMQPLLTAADTPSALDGTRGRKVINPGDVILIVKPPHWESDAGNETKQLQKYKAAYEARGIRVIEVQQQNSLFGFYKPDGPSDNRRILEHFVNMDGRDPKNALTPAYGTGDLVAAFDAKDIMAQAVQASGDPGKFTVFTDMDPYTAEGALAAGIPRSQLTDLSNHIGLMDPGVKLAPRSDAFLVHANNHFAGNAAVVGFDASINKLSRLAEAFRELQISPTTPKQEVRRRMIELLLKDGNKLSLEQPVGTAGGVLVAPGATAGSINRVVYLYLNAYTGPLGKHIQNKLREPGDNAYKHTMFVVAGGQTIPGHNAMNLVQVANADAVVAGGMGTSTEGQQLIVNGYQGKMILMPVENQHEQQINARQLLPAALPAGLPEGTVTTADDNADLQRRVDDLVTDGGTPTEQLTGDMQELFDTANSKKKVTDQPVQLLDGGPMTPQETALHRRNVDRAQMPDSLAMRRMVNALLPALKAVLNDEPIFTVKMGPDYAAQTLTFKELAATLRNRSKAAQLLHADTSGPATRKLLLEAASRLDRIAATTDPDRRKSLAGGFWDELSNKKFILGY